MSNEQKVTAKDLDKIAAKLEVVMRAGFGEVIIKVKNGAIYRIIKSEEEYIEEKK